MHAFHSIHSISPKLRGVVSPFPSFLKRVSAATARALLFGAARLPGGQSNNLKGDLQ
jgi:hypothetical protein